jgi:hypothetical protein
VIEALVPLKLPPGLQNSGTTYQSKGRWRVGNCVRFHEGTIQPIGGWVQRTLTGASIVGTPNAAISWQTNDGASYLAIGTTTNLYLIANSTQVYDITPTTVTTDGLTHYWQLDTFGQYLIAAFNEGSVAAPSNIFKWEGVVGVAAIAVTGHYFSPSRVHGIVVTPERFLVALRGADPGTVATGAFAPSAYRID